MKKYYCISIVIFAVISTHIDAEIFNVGTEEIAAPIFAQISITLVGNAWILDAGNSQFGSTSTNPTSIISLLEITEEQDTTRFIVLRKKETIDTLVFSRNNLSTGQNYIYSITIQWLEADSDIFSNMNISFDETENTQNGEIENNINVLEYDASKYDDREKNTYSKDMYSSHSPVFDNDTTQNTDTSLSQDVVQELEFFSNDIITIVYIPYTKSSFDTSNSTEIEAVDRNNTNIDDTLTAIAEEYHEKKGEDEDIQEEIDSSPIVQETNTEQSSTESSNTVVIQNDIIQQDTVNDEIAVSIDSREQSIQQDTISNQEEEKTDSANTSNTIGASIDPQELQIQVEKLWNNNRKDDAEKMVLSWVQKNENYTAEAKMYYILATMYETTATEIDDITKAIDFYNVIRVQYTLSQYYQIAQQRIDELQNTYIFIR